MKTRADITLWLMAAFLLPLCNACRGQKNSAPPLRVARFDKAVLHLVENDSPQAEAALLKNYPQMTELLGKGVLDEPSTQRPDFFKKLVRYYSEPTLHKLYREAVAQYDSIPAIEQGLGNGFAYLKRCFPGMAMPQLYLHVSGLGQNLLSSGNLLSLSIDKYMGKEYPLYREYFYAYQREAMQKERIVPDFLAGWLMTVFPFQGKEDVLLDRMIYEGKIKYLLAQALPDTPPELLMGYTKEEYAACRKQEGLLWKTLLERKQLYKPDRLTTARYFDPAPSTFLAEGVPGNLGVWFGWQIVKRYMEKTGSSPEALMHDNDAQGILAASGYKPF
ncbi:MAG: gliding motility protein GldB [Tannerella sp.]|nr:gliding motility protein GldB [Tannerella sp.]